MTIGATPTFLCKIILRREVEGVPYKIGEIVEMSYGMALLAVATGYAAFAEEDAIHQQAMNVLTSFGADAWFKPSHQTVPKLMAAQQAESSTVH